MKVRQVPLAAELLEHALHSVGEAFEHRNLDLVTIVV
jgi:hypothetical protein